MALRLFLTAICILTAPSRAAADDYKRKDYRESYERHYERAGKTARQATDQRFLNPHEPQASGGPYDEYNLYQWTRARHPNDMHPPDDLKGLHESIQAGNARQEAEYEREQARRELERKMREDIKDEIERQRAYDRIMNY